MKNILVLSKYSRMGASSRLRTYQYIPFLEANGYKVEISCLYDDEYLETYYATNNRDFIKVIRCYFARLLKLFSFYKYDTLYIEKELFPYMPAFFERGLKLCGVKYIVDYDDAVFHNYDSSKNIFVRFFLSKKIDAVMKCSYSVIVGNDYLYNRAKSSGAKKITKIPTVIDASRYSIKDFKQNSAKLIIGWIGSPYTQKYLKDIADPLRQLSKTLEFKLKLIGANSDILQHLYGIETELIPWSEGSEVENIRSFDVGIMPLPDEKFEHGKCGYKLIQYMACGIPVVASDIGVNKDIIEGSESGFLVKDSKYWDKAIIQILSDKEKYKKYSDNARKAVIEEYCMQVQQKKILGLFEELIIW